MDKVRADRVRGLLKQMRPTEVVTVGVAAPTDPEDLFADDAAAAKKLAAKRKKKPKDDIEIQDGELDYQAPATTT